jgi:hypothetical protein
MAHFYLMKKSPKVLLYFGLHCGMLEFFEYSSHQPHSNEQLLTVPHFGGKDCGFEPIRYNPSAEEVGRIDVFLYERLRTLHSFQIFKINL